VSVAFPRADAATWYEGLSSVRAVGSGPVVKKVLGWIVAAFLVYYLIAAPTESARAVRQVGEGLRAAVNSVLTFFDGLTP
jgi:hypothetical protein